MWPFPSVTVWVSTVPLVSFMKREGSFNASIYLFLARCVFMMAGFVSLDCVKLQFCVSCARSILFCFWGHPLLLFLTVLKKLSFPFVPFCL